MSADWQAAALEHLRGLILTADPAIVETVKWRKPTRPEGVPVWERGGILCTGERYKAHIKLTFMHGAALPDPGKLFTTVEGGARRTIDLKEGETVDAAAFQALIRAAVARNLAR